MRSSTSLYVGGAKTNAKKTNNMAQNPTVIVGHIDDQELRTSINNLVTFVDESTKKMANSFQTNLAGIKSSFEELNKIKFDGVKRNARAAKTTFDDVAKTLQKATQEPVSKSAQDSFYTFIQHYREQAAKLANEIKNMPDATLNRQIEEHKRWQREIDATKDRIRQLKENIERTPNPNAARGMKGVLGEEWKKLNELQREQILGVQRVAQADQQALAQKKAAYAEALKALKELTSEENKSSQAAQQASNISKERAATEAQAAQQNQAYYQQLRNEIVKVGEAAYKASIEIRNNMMEQLGRPGNASIQGIKELYDAWTKMRNLYFQMSENERATPFGKNLWAEIQKVDKAITAIQGYNKALLGGFGGSEATDPVARIKALEEAIERMKKSYWGMSEAQRESPVGQALKKDIETAQKARDAVQEYNKALLGNVVPNHVVDTTKSSIAELQRYQKQLSDAFKNIKGGDMGSSEAKALAANIQHIEREIQKLQTRMKTPVSLQSILGFTPQNLDDIAYKIQMLSRYRNTLNFTDPKQKGEIDQVNAALTRLRKEQQKYFGDSQKVLQTNNALTRSWNYMKNRLAFYFTVGASTQFVKNLIDIRSQYEMNERALGILINSAERGSEIFQELSNMALVSPYTLIELSAAAKQLTAYDVAARDVVDTTRRLADMASAVGVPMERLTYALGQIKAYGYLNSRDNRMFANAGIPLTKQLAEYYTELEGKLVSTADVYERIKKHAVDYKDVMQVIYKMTDEGGKFFDFQAKMADTLKVRLANLTLAWNNMLNEIGKDTQGFLTFTIGGLRQLFLHWKQLDHLIKSAAWIGGITVATRLLTWGFQRAMFALRGTAMTMTLTSAVGKTLATVLRTIGQSLKTIVTSPVTWWGVLALAVWEAGNMIIRANQAMVQLNKSLREGAESNYKNITDFLTSDSNVDARKTLASGDLNKNDADKLWESVREQIELATKESDNYISKLMEIGDVSERIRQGFKLLENLQEINGALKEIGDDGIKITQDWSKWWNLWLGTDGLIGNLKDIENAEKAVVDEFGSIGKAREEATGTNRAWELTGDYEEALRRLQDDIKVTTDSIINFIELKGWSGDTTKIDEVFSQVWNKIAMDNNLDPQKLFQIQLAASEAQYEAKLRALNKNIDDENKALAIARDENARKDIETRLNTLNTELSFLKNNTAQSQVYWRDYTGWIKREHLSEMTAMFRDMSQEQIANLDFTKGKYYDWVTSLARQYAKEHKMAYSDVFTQLQNYIKSANMWSIFIPLTIGTGTDKSIFEILTGADTQANDAWSKIQRLQENKKRLEGLGATVNGTRTIDMEYKKNLEEIADAQKDYNDALAKGGKSSKEEAANKKAAAAARKRNAAAAREQKTAEQEVTEALREELSLINTMQSNYDKLRKAGVDNITAVTIATQGYETTIERLNQLLAKYGISKFNASDFAGKDINAILRKLETQRNELISSGKVKMSALKDLNVEIGKLTIDAKTYNMKKITDGLNAELNKLKDDYELAVELDANPELGGIFANMFGIDQSTLSSNIYDLINSMQKAADKAVLSSTLDPSKFFDVFFKGKSALPPTFDLLTGDIHKWAEETGQDVNGELAKQLTDAQKHARDMMQKYLTDVDKQTRELQYKLADTNGKIAIEEEKLALLEQQLARETTEEKKRLLELQIQDQKETIEKLKEEIFELLPTYKAVFGGLAEHSAYMTRKLAKNLRDMLINATDNGDGTFTVTDTNGQKATLSKKQRGKQLDKVNNELLKSQTIIQKLKEAFTKGEDGVVDFSQGLQYISEELKKLSDLVNTIGDIGAALGMNEETQEVIGDIGTTLDGLSQAAEGYAKLQSGDIIGGVTGIIKGAWTAVSTWFDNSDKAISRKIKESEKTVRELELAYKDLEFAVEHSLGAQEIAARRTVAVNKQMQLAEKERQLELEKSRKKKNQDEDAIASLEGEIKDLKNEITELSSDVANTLLGSDIKAAAEDFVSTWVSAWRQGENTMDSLNEKFDGMIDNMIAKSLASKVVAQRLQPIYDVIDTITGTETDEEMKAKLKEIKSFIGDGTFAKDINDFLVELYGYLGIGKGSGNGTSLSALQQGIQGITEDTAGALEAYMNGVSQQVYLHSDLLIQIRDAVVGFELDAQVATISQILLQLRSSYEIQNAIHGLLNGWSTPNGTAVKVELI